MIEPSEIGTPPAAEGDGPNRDRLRFALFGVVLVVAAVRLWFCSSVPVNTTDLIRSIHTALYVLRDGPAVAGTPLVELDAGLAALGWASAPYSYPPLALPFFVVIAWISPTMFAAKLALTLIEALNAGLIARISGSRWLGAAYWASPASIWWVSGEGQFEPLMAVFMLGAITLIRRRPLWACALLGLGVNVKLSALLLLPWCMWVLGRERPADRVGAALSFSMAVLVPLAVAALWYPVVEGVTGLATTLRYNPYYWNVLDRSAFRWNPTWLIAVNAVATWAVLAVLVVKAWRSEGGWPRLGGAIAFVVLVKISALAQFWYFLLFPAFVMPLDGEPGRVDLRWWLVALSPLLDVNSLVELVVGPFGWLETALYENLSAFTPFGLR